MKTYLNFKPDGIYVDSVVTTTRQPEGSVMLPDGYRHEQGFMLFRPDGETIQERPPGPSVIQVSDTLWRAENVEEGTHFEIQDEANGETIFQGLVEDIEAGTMDIEFEDEGFYEVTLIPPLPYRPTRVFLKVEAHNVV